MKSISILFLGGPRFPYDPSYLHFLFEKGKTKRFALWLHLSQRWNKKNVNSFGSTFLKGGRKKIEILFNEYW